MRKAVSNLERFYARVQKTPEGCWLWTGGKNKGGYGSFTYQENGRPRTARAHRWLWEQEVRPLLPHLHLDHLCRNRACVNPKHLEVVTLAENNRRGNGWSGRLYQRTKCHRGHELNGIKRIKGQVHRYCVECDRASKRAYYHRNKSTVVVGPVWTLRKRADNDGYTVLRDGIAFSGGSLETVLEALKNAIIAENQTAAGIRGRLGTFDDELKKAGKL